MKLKSVIRKFRTMKRFEAAVEREITKIAKERPNFTYRNIQKMIHCDEDCSYYDRGPSESPRRCKGCIFGQALFNLGWTDKEERKSGLRIVTLMNLLGEYYPPLYWAVIQKMNDDGKTFGEIASFLNLRD